MAQQIELSDERHPHSVGRGGNQSSFVHAMKTHNGDVEVTRTIGGSERTVITVIPKEKRAALAQFLVESD